MEMNHLVVISKVKKISKEEFDFEYSKVMINIKLRRWKNLCVSSHSITHKISIFVRYHYFGPFTETCKIESADNIKSFK